MTIRHWRPFALAPFTIFAVLSVSAGEDPNGAEPASAAALPVPKVWGWVAPGGRTGGDRGPAEVVKMVNSMYYDNTWASAGVGATWEECEPVEGQFDWTILDAHGQALAPLRATGKVMSGFLWLWETDWSPPYDTPEFWFYFERFLTEMVRRANQWGTYVWVFDNEPEGRGAVTDHGRNLFHVARALRAASPDNVLISPNIAGSVGAFYDELYNNWDLKGNSTVIGSHQYSADPNAGVDIAGTVNLHNIMATHGDGDKKIWLGEGWAPYSALGEIFRPNHDAPFDAREVEAIRRTVVNGYRNMTTSELTPGFNPDWLWGASFFTMNDWYNRYDWRNRAVSHDVNGDSITDYYTIDGYIVGLTIDPSFNSTGLCDFRGNSKDDIMDVYPGGNVSLANPGFEIEWDRTAPYAWDVAPAAWIDASIRKHGRQSLRLSSQGSGTVSATQRTVRHSITPGRTYTLAAWCRVFETSGWATVRLRFVNASGGAVGGSFSSPAASGSADWQRLVTTATAPAGADMLEAGLLLEGGTGTAWFDDVSVNAGSALLAATVRGAVVDDDYNPLPGATVYFDEGRYSAATGADGTYTIGGVTPGTYDIHAVRPGYGQETATRQIAPAGRTRVASFVLPRLRERVPVGLRVYDPGTGDRLHLEWENPTSPLHQSVNVYRAENINDPGTLLLAGITGNTATVTGLETGRRDYLFLRAVLAGSGAGEATDFVLAQAAYGEPDVFYQVQGNPHWDSVFTHDWGQTFTPPRSFDLGFISCMIGTGDWSSRRMRVTVRDGGPAGAVIGPTIERRMTGNEFTRFYWGAGEVPLVAGRTYYVHFTSPDGGFGMYRNASNPYPNGSAFANGASLGNVDIWSTMAGARPPAVGIHDVRATATGAGRLLVEWSSEIPATSRVEYGLTASYGNSTALDPSETETHAVVVSGLELATLYHYRVHGTWSGGSTETTLDYTVRTSDSILPLDTPTSTPTLTPFPTPPPSATPTATPTAPPGVELLDNPGFEADGRSSVNPPRDWRTYSVRENADGTLQNGDYEMSFTPVGGQFAAGKITNWGTPYAGFYQQVDVSPDWKHACTVKLHTPLKMDGTPGQGRLGVDPAGGTDPNASGIVWTAWTASPDGWTHLGFEDGTAIVPTGNRLTLFLELRQDTGYWWNGMLFDAASVKAVEPAVPVTPAAASSIVVW